MNDEPDFQDTCPALQQLIDHLELPMLAVPAQKQTDPAKAPGQIHREVTLADYISRITDPKPAPATPTVEAALRNLLIASDAFQFALKAAASDPDGCSAALRQAKLRLADARADAVAALRPRT